MAIQFYAKILAGYTPPAGFRLEKHLQRGLNLQFSFLWQVYWLDTHETSPVGYAWMHTMPLFMPPAG